MSRVLFTLVDEVVRCAKCSADTRVTEAGIKVDELAANLLALLAEFGPLNAKGKVYITLCYVTMLVH